MPQPQVVDFRRSHSSRTTSESSNDREKSGDYGSGGENHWSDSEEQLPDYGGDFGEGQSASEGSSACSNAGNDLERVLAQPTHNLSMGQGAESASVEREPKKLRRRFGPDEDYMLAIQVNADEPFKAKHGEVGKCSDILAGKLNKGVNFNTHAIKGTTAKTRFEAILEKHNTWDKKSKGKSGVNERYNNYVQLMTELATKVSDHADEAAKEKESKAMKERAKVSSGEVVRMAAVSRLGKRSADDALNTSREDTEPQQSKRKQNQETALADIFAELNKQRSNALADLVKLHENIAEKAATARIEEFNKQLEIEAERTKQRRLELEHERKQRERDHKELIALLLRREKE